MAEKNEVLLFQPALEYVRKEFEKRVLEEVCMFEAFMVEKEGLRTWMQYKSVEEAMERFIQYLMNQYAIKGGGK